MVVGGGTPTLSVPSRIEGHRGERKQEMEREDQTEGKTKSAGRGEAMEGGG